MHLNIAVGIPTIGRAPVLREILSELGKQTRGADSVIVCGTKPEDVKGVVNTFPGIQVLIHSPGASHQRNAIIAAAKDVDIIVFFDDDFLPDIDYLAAIERHMLSDKRIAVATGHVVADGITGPGFSIAEGHRLLNRATAPTPGTQAVFSGYGCNMAVRVDLMRKHGLTFDERLPLYSWQEDVDLSRRLAAYGTVVRIGDARGVHLGVKLGRGTGVKLGYSQVANPFYLANKKTGYPLSRAIEHLARNMAMNIARAAWPEPYIDRRGRLRGNILALRDLAIGRMLPERVLDL